MQLTLFDNYISSVMWKLHQTLCVFMFDHHSFGKKIFILKTKDALHQHQHLKDIDPKCLMLVYFCCCLCFVIMPSYYTLQDNININEST